MRNHWMIVLLFSTSLLISACQKDKWKQPTQVSFKMDVNSEPGMNGQLTFTGGKIVLREFSFEGERVQGDDVYFEKSFPGGLIITFNPNSGIPELSFDIPQGNYTKIRVEFEAEGNTDNSIFVEGSYTTTGGTTYPLRLETEAVELYSIIAKHSSGSNEIVLVKDTPANALIKLDPVHWFGTVSTTLLDNADLINVNGIMTILINDANNGNILDIVLDRVDEASEVVFD